MTRDLFKNFSDAAAGKASLTQAYELLVATVDGALAAKTASQAQRGYVSAALKLATDLAAAATAPSGVPARDYAAQLAAQAAEARAQAADNACEEDAADRKEKRTRDAEILGKCLPLARQCLAQMRTAKNPEGFPEMARQYLLSADFSLLTLEKPPARRSPQWKNQ